MVQVESGPEERLFHRQLLSDDLEGKDNRDIRRPLSALELIPENYFAPLDLAAVFRRPAPLEIDLGCGDGAFLAALAERFPERNFLGIEKLLGRVRRSCRCAERSALENVRVLRVETAYAVEYLLPPGSTEVVHLLFPDPWPKKRHQGRRIVTPNFLATVHRLLVPNGSLRIATDEENYFAAIRELVAGTAFAEQTEEREALPLTTFEKRYLDRGTPIYRLVLRKVV